MIAEYSTMNWGCPGDTTHNRSGQSATVRAIAGCCALVLVLTSLLVGVASAKDPGPAARITLEELGYQTMPRELLLSGSSVMTMDFIDDQHLLVTFGLRRLMRRDEVTTENDDDRTVGAFLLELPSGKVLAKTEWRLHDRGQYLWSLGNGRFLLRVKDQLTLLHPLAELAEGGAEKAFQQLPFLRMDREVLAIFVSAQSDLVTLETSEHVTKPDPAAASPPVQLNFYRMIHTGPLEKMVVVSAGVLRTRTPVILPLTTSGFLDVIEGGKGEWLFNFANHAGAVSELPAWETTCYPHATFVTRGEFVAFGCRGSSDRQVIGGFNLKGEEMWQQSFFDGYVAPQFAFAPAAGRFALERGIVASSVDPAQAGLAGDVVSQEVRVYQAYSGKILFKTDCSPVVRAGGNIALSPDGLRLAVVHETTLRHAATKFDEAYTTQTAAIDLYDLPPLSAKDTAAVKEIEEMAPPDTGARIDLSLKRISHPAAAGSDAAAGEQSATAAEPTAAPPVEQPNGPSSTAALGDAAQGEPRKPPTLYGPDETPPARNH